MADLRLDPHEVARPHPEPGRVPSVQPERVRVRDLVQPLAVGRARVDLHRQPECGDEAHLVLVHHLRVYVAADVGGDRVLRPAPAHERGRVELELAARRREAAAQRAVGDAHAHGAAALRVGFGRAHRGQVRRRRARGARVDAAELVLPRIREFLRRHLLLVQGTDVARHLEGTEAPHVVERSETLGRRRRGQPRHGMIEDPGVVLVHRQPLPRVLPRLDEGADAAAPVRVDAPRQLQPELVLLPHLSRIRVARVRHLLAEAGAGGAEHGLAEGDPLAVVRLVGVQVVTLGAVSHREDVVREVGRFVPRRRERHVQTHLLLVRERLDPAEAVRVRPHRVVDAGEVHVELPAPLLQEVGEKEGDLVHRERVLVRPGEFVPVFRVAGHPDRLGNELVPSARIGAAGRGDGTGEGVEEEEGARHLPPPLVAGGGAAPVVRGEPRAGPRHDLGHLAQLGRVHAGFRRRPLEGAVRVQLPERGLERRERARQLGLLGREILLPVEPAAHEVAVPGAGRDEVVRDREQDGGLGAGLRGQPMVGVGGRVR